MALIDLAIRIQPEGRWHHFMIPGSGVGESRDSWLSAKHMCTQYSLLLTLDVAAASSSCLDYPRVMDGALKL